MIRSVQNLLLLLCALLAVGVCVVLLLTPSRWVPPAPLPPELDSLQSPSMLAMPERVSRLEETASRPLFIAGRRPVVEDESAPAPVAQPDEPFPEADLLGLFGSGEESGVILSSEGKALRVRIGEEWSGWTLRSVDAAASSAHFVAAGRDEHILELKRQPQRGTLVYSPGSAPASDKAKDGGAADVGQADEVARPG